MEPLPIVKMNIEVYNIEESPLHQIVKKLIYKKILDLEPYNFNHVNTSISGFAKSIYGEYASPSFDEMYGPEGVRKPEKYSFQTRDVKQKEIRETMTWDDPKIKILLDNISETGRQEDRVYSPNPFEHHSRKAISFIPLRPYAGKVVMERPFFLDGLRIIPDITLMDDNGKPETVIEILYTSMPKADKLIKLIESNLNVVFVFADQAVEELSTDMTCRRDYFKFPIREAWHGDTPTMEKLSRAVNILLQKKMYTPKEYIISKKIITNTQWLKGSLQWRKSRMKVGLKITTNEGERDLSHSMIQMKETSTLIKLLRHIKKIEEQKKDLDDGMEIPVFEGTRG